MRKTTKIVTVAAIGVQKPATKLNKKQAMKQKMQAVRDRKKVVQAQRRAEELAADATAEPTVPVAGPSEPLQTVGYPSPADQVSSSPSADALPVFGTEPQEF